MGGSDSLFGQGGADKLLGGLDVDRLTGGPANDALSGGELTDFYYFGDGWGKDTISDSIGNWVLLHRGPDELVYVTENLTIKLHSGEGPEVKNASGTNTIDWEGNAIAQVTSGAGDDQITGNFSDNLIDGTSGGADTISTGGGDDTINVNDGSGDDIVDCGENIIIVGSGNPDNDTVYHDSGDTIDSDCENPLAQP